MMPHIERMATLRCFAQMMLLRRDFTSQCPTPFLSTSSKQNLFLLSLISLLCFQSYIPWPKCDATILIFFRFVGKYFLSTTVYFLLEKPNNIFVFPQPSFISPLVQSEWKSSLGQSLRGPRCRLRKQAKDFHARDEGF